MSSADVVADNNFHILNKDSLPEFLSNIPAVVKQLGSCDNLSILEIGDGNLNFVFRVSNADDATKAVIVKQAVPYLRMAGEGWPLGRDRMRYEIRALAKAFEIAPQLVPKIYHADEDMSTLVMQFLDDHIILRIGMIEGIRYPDVGRHIGEYMARTLFNTSAWAMPSVERRELMDQFTLNSDLCKLTEDFIFTFPYITHDSNYSNPSTDEWVKQNIHTDIEYKKGVLHFKNLFVSKTEALLHGDLHSGSVMVNQDETYVIDPEFAFFGPISFDVGKVIANFLLSCTSHFYRDGGAEYRQWLIEQIEVIWNTFEAEFLALWSNSKDSTLLVNGYFDGATLDQYRADFMSSLVKEATGFAACSMARRTVGIAGVADIRDIEDIDIRSKLEIANLKLSKQLMAERNSIENIGDLITLITQFYSDPIL